jgi:hypothetical protein
MAKTVFYPMQIPAPGSLTDILPSIVYSQLYLVVMFAVANQPAQLVNRLAHINDNHQYDIKCAY